MVGDCASMDNFGCRLFPFDDCLCFIERGCSAQCSGRIPADNDSVSYFGLCLECNRGKQADITFPEAPEAAVLCR